MFHSATLKLTAWYLVIIMAISIAFTAFIYRGVAIEFQERLKSIEARLELKRFGFYPPPGQVELFIKDLEDAKSRIFNILVYTNLTILVFSAVAGYFLAKKTLSPIEEAMDEQKRFVADASHEFKTPLTALHTSIEVALRDKSLNLKDAKAILKDSLRDVESLSSLSGYLLGLARFQKDNVITKTRLNLSDLVGNSVKKINPLAKEKNIVIATHLEKVLIKGNPESLEKLITILLDNAVKYSGNNTKITVNSYKTGRSGVVEVKDQGIGISKKDLPHIFERFYRSDPSRTKFNVDGFGLGLSMAKEIADAHNGKVKVKSTTGIGSAFKVVLPA